MLVLAMFAVVGGGASLDMEIQELAAKLRVIRGPLVNGSGAKVPMADCKVVVGHGVPLIEVITLKEVLEVGEQGLIEC